jgi:hypothetical protein
MNPNAEEFYARSMQEKSQSTLTFSPIPVYSPIPEIVADADEITSNNMQMQEQQTLKISEWENNLQKIVSLGNSLLMVGVTQKWKALKKHRLRCWD